MGACFPFMVNAYCSAGAPGTINFPSTIAIQRDVPIGATLATGQLITSINCDAEGGNGSWLVRPSTNNSDYGTTTLTEIRQTPVSGVGIRWINLDSNTGTNLTWSTAALNSYTSGGRGIAQTGITTFTDTFELVKTGPIITNTMPSRVLYYSYENPDDPNQSVRPLFEFTLNSLNVVVLACNVTQTIIPVNLGNGIQSKIFTRLGSTSPDTPFSIPLDCDANARVNFQIDGNESAETAQPGILRLNSGNDSATGLGVQILHNGNSIALGTPIFDSVTTSSGPYNINFVARYYQTRNTVTAGTANATATFTLTYQ